MTQQVMRYRGFTITEVCKEELYLLEFSLLEERMTPPPGLPAKEFRVPLSELLSICDEAWQTPPKYEPDAEIRFAHPDPKAPFGTQEKCKAWLLNPDRPPGRLEKEDETE